ncbi:MAG: FAD-dependent oxidoreductase [Alphaproteobacteria bacterium]|nr:FAD-dependent oxidoreductase [Gammaproteobacteria bacterium]MDA7988723.1 FAD-dependent oxidoreductase [Alphaproteobacteria bacterium]MDA8000657.1 FAD-dependent oxidoreductase [Alphaproteobacteria bacterium]MDA8005945.1 FAD-dependent oxidoreductase [Alphaproteobacteria bacterium]MDA8010395.1 FAD-dependent oxidoreductase [Alphaproteobacteria bacterium]
MSKHVIVIGAGIVGVSTAVYLRRAGFNVTLLDKQEPGEGTSYGNAGVIASPGITPVTHPRLPLQAPGMLLNKDSPLFLRWRGVPRMLPWLTRYMKHCTQAHTLRITQALYDLVNDSYREHEAIARGTLAERHLCPSDYVFVYPNRAAVAADAFSLDLHREYGFRWREREGAELSEYEPMLADSGQTFSSPVSVSFEGHGYISDPGEYVKDLARHFAEQGGEVMRAEASEVVSEGGRVVGVRAGGEVMKCDVAVLSCGVWSGGLARAAGVKAPVETERGYHLELWGTNTAPRFPLMLTPYKFVLTPMRGRVRCAGLVEFGGLGGGPSRAPLALLERVVRRTFPDLRWERKTEWLGHRPAVTDSIPLIGGVSGLEGMYFGFGHHHIGLTSGPRTGRWLSEMIGGRTNMDLGAYSPMRFAKN